MEVLDTNARQETNVLIGQQNITQSFGIANDATLMSMLSTGFYSNPLRTMLQEVMFNAWDAHKEAGCTDKPIDVHVSQDKGILIRDYGLGIPPNKIKSVYCVYGSSTKRKDENLTGGFGLGSKSPFTISDYFNATSYHNNKKAVYLLNRVTEENNGGPGITPLVQDIPTEEQGMLITIPLSNDFDANTAKNHIKSLVVYSGMRINFYYEDRSVELLESEEEPEEGYTFATYKSHNRNSAYIKAVYGGVKYDIPEFDDVNSDMYNDLYQVTRAYQGNILLFFPPNSLTPLPNREGLNFNKKTAEAINEKIEEVHDKIKKRIKNFAAKVLINLKEEFDTFDFPESAFKEITQQTLNQEKVTDIVDRYARTMNDHSKDNFFEDIINHNYYRIMDIFNFTKEEYEDFKDIICTDNTEFLKRSDKRDQIKKLFKKEYSKRSKDYIDLLRDIKDLTGKEVNLRAYYESTWQSVTNNRSLKKDFRDIGYSKRELAHRFWDKNNKQNKLQNNRLFIHKGPELDDTYLPNKKIILARNLQDLDKVNLSPTFDLFCPKNFGKFTKLIYSQFNYHNTAKFNTMALVISKCASKFDEVKKLLEDKGFEVVEAPSLKEKVEQLAQNKKPLPEEKSKEGYYTYLPKLSQEFSEKALIQKPQTYFYCTKTKLQKWLLL